jgi:hypothetical protein
MQHTVSLGTMIVAFVALLVVLVVVGVLLVLF